jgi:regulator of protease activity HflC (stomatin/prohibitin superfamily)
VPKVRDLLDRFRPAGAPGAPSAAGVPADRYAAAAAELEPVFAELSAVVWRCEEIRQEAIAAATRRETEAEDHARAMIARARAQSEAERASAAATLREQAAQAASRALDNAEADAGEIRRSGDARRDALLDLVLERVRADLRTSFTGGGGPS